MPEPRNLTEGECPLCGESEWGSLPDHIRERCPVAEAGRERVAAQDTGEGLVIEVT